MEDVELIGVGLLFAAGVSFVELRVPMPGRAAISLGVAALTAALLWVLGLSIDANGMDFLQANIGAFLGAGLVDSWWGTL